MNPKTLKKIILSIIIIYLCVINVNECKKKKKKEKDIDKVRALKRPSVLDDKVYCFSCYIPMYTITQRLKPQHKELEILNVVTESCNQAKGFYSRYKSKFKPSLIKDACEAFVINWEDYIIKNVNKIRKNNQNINDLVNNMCYEVSAACKNVFSLEEIHSNVIEVKEDL
jgi:hypothetical protein